MEPDELQHGLTFLRVEIQARHEAVGEFYTLSGVFAGASRLAGVM